MTYLLASSGHMAPGVANSLGWAAVIAVIAIIAGLVLRLLGILK